MIPIALHRRLSGNITCSDVRQREQGHTSEGLLDKSADVRHAHVVGWIEFSRCYKKPSAGASHRNTRQIKSPDAVAHFGAALSSHGTT